MHFLLARRLVEAGVPVVHFNFGYWDWHGENFIAGRQQIPMFDAALSALLDDLDVRGLLDSTIVLALGEMGRKPKMRQPEGGRRRPRPLGLRPVRRWPPAAASRAATSSARPTSSASG